ncbi:hypothetical protein [Salinisphaera sp. T31B1]|uniref:hypothetical protein n=1 Tax=Salinisphaera sp. T31B1 TaxID=727963 RepID=UPI003341E373
MADVIASTGRDDQKALRRALRHAYPFAERSGYAYKAWLTEVKAQLSHGLRADRTAEHAGQVDAFKQQERQP